MHETFIILACLLADSPARPAPLATDYAMESDPLLADTTVVKGYSETHLPLWLQALDRPEADLQRLAAESVAQSHLDGAPKMDQARPALLRIVSAEGTHPAARFTAARALIVLESREAAPQLFQAAQKYGGDVRHLVEPALAHWKHEPAYAVWRKRLDNAGTGHRDTMLAFRCLGEIQDETALPQLLAIAHAPLRPDVERLAAARACGQIKDAGLETEATKLSRTGATMIDRLCAVALLERHDSEPARALLLALALDPQPSIATAALSRLNALDVSLVLPLAEKAMQNSDSGVRREGARSYASRPTTERLKTLGKLLDDPHPGIRALVREEFRHLAGDPQWNDTVRQSALEALAAESWRGQETAALLLAGLDHKAAAPRLVALLDSPREEVMVASAWGLRKLAVPETLPAMLAKANYLTDVRTRQQRSFIPLDRQAAQLLEAFGQMKYKPAEPLMKRYIPKDYGMGEYSRSAAIWGLGKLHAGDPDPPLVSAIVGRVTESSMAVPPEMSRVRLAGTIALGHMKAKSQAGVLRQMASSAGGGGIHYSALQWSLREMTGEELPNLPPVISFRGGWFLEPLENGSK